VRSNAQGARIYKTLRGERFLNTSVISRIGKVALLPLSWKTSASSTVPLGGKPGLFFSSSRSLTRSFGSSDRRAK
jgi:hypothetical protein